MDEMMRYCSSFKLKNVIAFVQVNREGHAIHFVPNDQSKFRKVSSEGVIS